MSLRRSVPNFCQGYVGTSCSIISSLGLDGAYLEQVLHFCHIALTFLFIWGQNKTFCALHLHFSSQNGPSRIHWSMSSCNNGGISILEPLRITFILVKSSWCIQNCQSLIGQSFHVLGHSWLLQCFEQNGFVLRLVWVFEKMLVIVRHDIVYIKYGIISCICIRESWLGMRSSWQSISIINSVRLTYDFKGKFK